MTARTDDAIATPAGDEADFALLVLRLWRGRSVIVASMITMAVLFGAIGFLITPIYRTATVILPASSTRTAMAGAMTGSLANLASLAGVDMSATGAPQVQEALAVLRSREFNEAFISEQDLLPKFFPKKWDASKQEWKVPSDTRPTHFQGYEYLSKIRTIDENKKTGLVTVQIEWRDPDEAAQWANALVERLNEVMRTRALERTEAYLSHLQRELESTVAVDTRAAINRLVESQINERMLANVTKEYAFRVVDKALAPDAREPVRPKKLLLTALGATAGALFGVLLIILSVPRVTRRIGT